MFTRNPAVYLAGPEVFLPDALAKAQEQRKLCERYGFIPLHPMDNNVHLGTCDYETAIRIYHGDVAQVRACNIVIANCNPFRSPCVIDDGTAYELGFANALGKPTYGYARVIESLVTRTVRGYPCRKVSKKGELELYADNEGYLIVDDFGTSINLMMQCGMTESGGRLIEGDFEACLAAVRDDLKTGKLKLL